MNMPVMPLHDIVHLTARVIIYKTLSLVEPWFPFADCCLQYTMTVRSVIYSQQAIDLDSGLFVDRDDLTCQSAA